MINKILNKIFRFDMSGLLLDNEANILKDIPYMWALNSAKAGEYIELGHGTGEDYLKYLKKEGFLT